jgi:hypothetical protein
MRCSKASIDSGAKTRERVKRMPYGRAAMKISWPLPVAPTAATTLLLAATGVVIDIDLSGPHREMREETRAFFAMSAGRDEAAFIHDHEKLSPSAPTWRSSPC